jgi:hypothetical protein
MEAASSSETLANTYEITWCLTTYETNRCQDHNVNGMTVKHELEKTETEMAEY